MIKEFLSSFMADLHKILEHEEDIDLSVLIQKVYHYSNQLKKQRKNF